MNVDVMISDAVTVIVPEGRVDSASVETLREALHEVLASGATQLVVDLEGVEYVTSAGLRELVTAYKQVNQKDGDLRLASPNERVREVLKITGLASIFTVYETRHDAVSSF